MEREGVGWRVCEGSMKTYDGTRMYEDEGPFSTCAAINLVAPHFEDLSTGPCRARSQTFAFPSVVHLVHRNSSCSPSVTLHPP